MCVCVCLPCIQETIDAVVHASHLPMSVLIVGIGTADFTNVRKLHYDNSNDTLRSSDGERAERDIVQVGGLGYTHTHTHMHTHTRARIILTLRMLCYGTAFAMALLNVCICVCICVCVYAVRRVQQVPRQRTGPGHRAARGAAK